MLEIRFPGLYDAQVGRNSNNCSVLLTECTSVHAYLRPPRAAHLDFKAQAVTSLARFNNYSFPLAIAKAVNRAQSSRTYGFHVDHFSEWRARGPISMWHQLHPILNGKPGSWSALGSQDTGHPTSPPSGSRGSSITPSGPPVRKTTR